MRILLALLLTLCLLSATAGDCLAVNFFDGARAPRGLYALTYSSLYTADRTTDNRGKQAVTDYGYTKLEQTFRLCYYSPEYVLTALVPLGMASSEFYDGSSQGPGDVIAGAGRFLPVTQADILPMVFVKLPTGAFDRDKSVNYGSNQYDIRPTVFLYRQFGRFSIDAAAKYFFRMENPATNSLPGDELHLQCLLGWQLGKKTRFGPSINWMASGPRRVDGNRIAESRRSYLSAGADFYFRLPRFSLTLTYLRDVHAKNTTKGDFFQVKTCYKF